MPIHDSGKRQEFSTGAVRDTAEGKPLLNLISPIYLRRLHSRVSSFVPCNVPADAWSEMKLLVEDYREGGRGNDPLILASLHLSTIMHFQETGQMESDSPDTGPIVSPYFVRRLGHWLTLGAEKYTARNWEKGINLDRTCGSLMRHITNYDADDESEDHLAAIACNLMFLVHTGEMVLRGLLPKELDDMPNYILKAGGPNND